MKIWIHLDNTQLGPYDITELPLDRMTPQTPVWYEGLAYWEPAGKSAKTAHLFNQDDIKVTDVDSQQTEPTDTTEPTVTDTADTGAAADIHTVHSAADSHGIADNGSQGAHMGGNYGQGRYNGYNRPYAAAQESGNAPEQCPATYIIWSVLLTVLCCNPIGIIPIILGVTVTNKYNNYNYEGARRASETTAWWLMITIVTSLVFAPLSMLTAAL